MTITTTRRGRVRRAARLATTAAISVSLVGVVAPGAEAAAPLRPTTAQPSVSSSSAPAASAKKDPLAGWTLRQKVGQLFMVGVPVGSGRAASYRAVTKKHVGNIFLAGRTSAGVGPVRNLVAAFTGTVSAKTTHGTPMLVATDQEGGLVQVLRGKGFSSIPTATAQSRWSTKKLRKRATRWGGQLADAGVNLNLAPVTDVVTSRATARTNAPIGAFKRNFGYGPTSTWTHADAFSAGMRAADVDVAIKHFPGLGRVAGNTDTTAHVVDAVTTARPSDPQITAFQHGIDAGAPFVMVSSAVYAKIDAKRPAAFSRKIVTTVLRKKMGFDGVVISDDLSAAKAVTGWKPGTRAVKFLKAGGDVVLVSADPTVTAEMVDAVVARARKSPAFAKQVDAAARRVLAAKADLPR